jgi:malate dehydrogenase (quinone)
VLIGAGIMSATLGTILKELDPALDVVMFETLHDCAQESSQAWNNAGTGHAANCELNYTPALSDGSIDISRALQVNTEFDVSRQLWSHLVTTGGIPDPRAFIEPCPHMSFVWGDANVTFLRACRRRCRHTIAITAWSTAKITARSANGARCWWRDATNSSPSPRPG